MTKLNNIPALRFREFEGEWEKSRLDEVAKIERGRFSPRPRNNPIYYGGKFPFVQTGDVTNSNGRISQYSQTLNEKGLKVSKLFPKGTILITIAANIGYTAILDIDMACPDSLIGIKCKKDFYNLFINYYLSIHQRKMDYLAPEGAQRNINIAFLNPFVVIHPTKPEQQKIANFLTAIDTKIQQLHQKEQLLDKYKKGVMQQIFKQEIRFKKDDGGAFEDWEVKRLGEITKYYDGTHQTPKYTETGVPFYSVEHLTRNNFSKTKFISEEVFQKENKRVKLEKGDILMTRIGDIGTSKLITWNVRASFYVSLALIKQSKQFNSAYLNQFIQSVFFQKELHKRTIHVAFPRKINLGEIGKCFVKLPSLPEQQKIANFLSSIDKRIASVQAEIVAMEAYKKGLLQVMFV